jgi:glucose/arabinose dehydrogenase
MTVMRGRTGAATIPLIDPEVAKTAKVVITYTFTGPNLTQAETRASGVRTPCGRAFSPVGELWEMERGSRAGDELDREGQEGQELWLAAGRGMAEHNGVPIPKFTTRGPTWPRPCSFWAPVIAPGNLMFYHGTFCRHSGQRSVGGDWQQHSPRLIRPESATSTRYRLYVLVASRLLGVRGFQGRPTFGTIW